MQIKILKTTRASGKHIYAGIIYDCPKDISLIDAKMLIQMGKAKIVEGKPEPGQKAEAKAETKPKPKPKAKEPTRKETKEQKRAVMASTVFTTRQGSESDGD